jgi:hypothetical protein
VASRKDFREWFLSLPENERERYALRAGTTPGYVRVHLIGRRKVPRRVLMEGLAEASDGRFTVPDLLKFFYQTDQHAA